MANVDVPRLLERYSGRIHLGHVKDIAKGVVVPASGYRHLNAIPGDRSRTSATVSWIYRRWIPLARKAGMRHFFVERIKRRILWRAPGVLPVNQALLS